MLGASEDRAHKEMGEVIEFMYKLYELWLEYYWLEYTGVYWILEDPHKYEFFETLAEVGHNYSEVGSFGSCTPDSQHHSE